MDRRSFLVGTGTLAAAGVGLSAPAVTQGRAEWRMVTTWPKNMPGLGPAAQRFAGRINAATDGRVSVRVHGAGELVPAFEAFDAVSRGDAEIYHGTESFWVGKHPGFAGETVRHGALAAGSGELLDAMAGVIASQAGPPAGG